MSLCKEKTFFHHTKPLIITTLTSFAIQKLGYSESPPLRLTLGCHHCISSYPMCLVAITALVRNTFTGKTAFLKKSLLYSENSLCKFTLWLLFELLIFYAMQQ